MMPQPASPDPATDAARRMLDSLEAHYQPTHRYVAADPKAFRHLDLGWYDRVARRFEGLGFRRLGDIEDRTITEAPNTVLRPTLLRTLVSRDGTVTLAMYDPRLKGIGLRLLLWVLRKLPRKVVDFETECSDGTFVATSNAAAAAAIGLPPQIDMAWLAVTCTPEQVYAEHTARLSAHLAARPGVLPRVIRTQEEMLRSQNRQNALKAAYRGDIPGLTTEELEALSVLGRGLVPRVKAAMETEHAARARAAS